MYFYIKVTSESGLESELAALQAEYQDYAATHVHPNSEYDAAISAKLVTKLGATDHNPWVGSDYLHISGEIWNVGTNAAHNCKLHVVLFHGNVASVDVHVDIGTIDGETYKDINEQVFYSGDPLTRWTIDVEWE